MRPEDIEKRSMELIAQELGMTGDALNGFGADETAVVMRAIHTTADFDFAKTMRFSKGAVALGRKALAGGCAIVTDTNMALSGISRPCSSRFGNALVCRVAEEETARAAKSAGTTRSAAAVDYCAERFPNAVYAFGNAPTALMRLCEHVKNGVMRPALVVGVPVGFVNVVESKLMLLNLDTPYILALGRKGGSSVAAAVINALYYGME